MEFVVFRWILCLTKLQPRYSVSMEFLGRSRRRRFRSLASATRLYERWQSIGEGTVELHDRMHRRVLKESKVAETPVRHEYPDGTVHWTYKNHPLGKYKEDVFSQLPK